MATTRLTIWFITRRSPKLSVFLSESSLKSNRVLAGETNAANHSSWEMSTIGHPLSDLSNILSPFIFALKCPPQALASRTNLAFSPSISTPGLPSRSQCLDWYTQIAGWNPGPDSGWGDAFGVFRNSVIMQGIAARYATRQASSARAKEYAMQMEPFGDFSWALMAALQREMAQPRSKI